MSLDNRRRRNLRAIETYCCTIRAARFPGTAGSLVETLQFTGKPQSSAPHTSAGERHLSVKNDSGDELPERVANARTRSIVEPVIEGYLRNWNSDSFWQIELAPTQIKAWKAGATQEAREEAWKFVRAIGEVEAEVEKRNPGIILEVYVNPEDEPQHPKTREGQKLTTLDTDRKIVQMLEEIEAEHECDRDAATGMLMDIEDYSYWRIRRAITNVNKERQGAA